MKKDSTKMRGVPKLSADPKQGAAFESLAESFTALKNAPNSKFAFNTVAWVDGSISIITNIQGEPDAATQKPGRLIFDVTSDGEVSISKFDESLGYGKYPLSKSFPDKTKDREAVVSLVRSEARKHHLLSAKNH
jgi:hypothetical protein